MKRQGNPDLLKAALALTQVVGSAAGVVVQVPAVAYLRGRTPDHVAEVARLARDHEAMKARIDSYHESRQNGYEDKANEVFVDTQDALSSKFALSQGPAKHT
jgi:signal transduction protein with GAF and PtsI domain